MLIRGSEYADATREMTNTGSIGVISSMVPVILSSMILFAK
jgi:hypothetical protein